MLVANAKTDMFGTLQVTNVLLRNLALVIMGAEVTPKAIPCNKIATPGNSNCRPT